jgi:hypothetical protein
MAEQGGAQDWEFTSRYGSDLPDPDPLCPGPCEGMGWVPVNAGEPDPTLRLLYQQSTQPLDEIGYRFVPCPDCDATGLRRPDTGHDDEPERE